MYYHELPCIVMYFYVLPCITMYYHVLPCIAMYYHVLPCIVMYCHVLPCITMYYHVYREYFMKSAGVRYLRTSCWRIRNRASERSERGRFLMQKQRVRKYRTKNFPCGIVFIIYILRHSSIWRPFYIKSFKTAKICRYTL